MPHGLEDTEEICFRNAFSSHHGLQYALVRCLWSRPESSRQNMYYAQSDREAVTGRNAAVVVDLALSTFVPVLFNQGLDRLLPAACCE